MRRVGRSSSHEETTKRPFLCQVHNPALSPLEATLTKKQGRGHPVPDQKFCNSSLPACQPCARTRTAATPIPSIVCFTILWMPGGRGHALPSGTAIPGRRSLAFHESRVTELGPQATTPLVPRYRCAATRKVPESRVLQLGGNRETFPLRRCLRY
jgi:hypothetical protein